MDTVILLHGWGERGERWQRLVEQVEARTEQPIRWITPTAPESPQAVAQGRVFPSWYDLELGKVGRLRAHMAVTTLFLEAAGRVVAQIETLVAQGTPAERIIVGGFSQGGNLALAVLLLHRGRLGGVFLIEGAVQALTTLRAYVEHLGGAAALANSATPVLYMLGERRLAAGTDPGDIAREFYVLELGFSHWHHRAFAGATNRVVEPMYAEVAGFIAERWRESSSPWTR